MPTEEYGREKEEIEDDDEASEVFASMKEAARSAAELASADVAERLQRSKLATVEPTNSMQVRIILSEFVNRQAQSAQVLENHAIIVTRIGQAIVVALSVVSVAGLIDKLGPLSHGDMVLVAAVVAVCIFSVTLLAVVLIDMALRRLMEAMWETKQGLNESLRDLQ